jgi:hypothetical protein
MTQGYTIREVQYTLKECFGCDYYNHRLLRSGKRPEYRDSCNHPQTIIDYVGKFRNVEDREIMGAETPSWCPAGKRSAE